MGWLTHILLYLFLVTAKSQFTANDLWTNSFLQQQFVQILSDNLAESGQFPKQEEDDLDAMSQVLLSALSNASTSGRKNATRNKALSIAWAAAIAAIITDEGGPQQIAAVVQALTQAFLQTTGVVDKPFIQEVRTLINAFAQDLHNDETINEITPLPNPVYPSIPSSKADFGAGAKNAADSTAHTSSSTTNTQTSTSALSSAQQTGTSSTSQYAYSLIQILTSSSTLASILAEVTSTAELKTLVSLAIQISVSQLGIASYISISAIVDAIVSLGIRVDIYSFARAIAGPYISALVQSGQLTAANQNTLLSQTASSIVQAFVSSSSSAAYGSSAASAASSATSTAGSASSTTTSTSTSSSAGSSTSIGSSGAFSFGLSGNSFGSALSDGRNLSSPLLYLPSSTSEQRIALLIQSIISAISQGDLNTSAFVDILVNLVSEISFSGAQLSSSELVTETLFELTIALINILISAKLVQPVAPSSNIAKSVSSAVLAVFSGK